jgi:hypothetical protein
MGGSTPPVATGGKPFAPNQPPITHKPAATAPASKPGPVAKPGKARTAQDILNTAASAGVKNAPAADVPAVDPTTAVSDQPLASVGTAAVPSPNANLTALSDALVSTFKMQFGNLWNNAFSADHQELLTDIMDGVAYIASAQLGGVDTQAMRAQIEAQLSNIQGVQHSQLVHAVWATLGQVAKSSLDFALKAAVTIIPAAVA